MKLNTLLIAAACAGTMMMTSCDPSMQEKQLKYTHTTLVDNDAYQFFQTVGDKVPFEAEYAGYAEGVASSPQAKQLAGKAKEVFSAIIPNLDTLATRYQVDFPIRGAKQFSAPTGAVPAVPADTTDSTATTPVVAVSPDYSDEAYVQHVQHEVAAINTHFKRLSRNTNKDLRDYATSQLEKLDELYKLAGGQVDAHAHH